MPASRILISINVRWWNAEAAYALNLASGLQAEGHRVWMIVNPGSPVHLRAVSMGIPVLTDILLDSVSPLQHLSNLRKLLQVVDDNQIQLVNSFKSNGAFLFSLLRRFRPGVCYIKTRGEARPPRRNFVNRRVYSGCDGIIAVGAPVKTWLQNLDLKDQRIEIVHFGDRGMERASLNERNRVRAELGIKKEAAVLTLLGRTQAVKGHRLMLEALSILQADPCCHLLFLVKDPDEFPLELRFLQEYTKENDLEKSVTILGFQEELARALSISDLGVIPSLDSEVNCRVAVEFFSMGIPVLSFPTGTLPDIIRHTENGFLAAGKNVESLVEGIRWFLADPERIVACGKRAKKDFCDFYTLEKMTRLTLEVYRRCCKMR